MGGAVGKLIAARPGGTGGAGVDRGSSTESPLGGGAPAGAVPPQEESAARGDVAVRGGEPGDDGAGAREPEEEDHPPTEQEVFLRCT